MNRLWAVLVLWPVLLSLVACAPQVNSVWTETFDTPGGWHLSSDAAADVAVDNGQLRIHVIEMGQVAWASAGRSYSDFHLAVEATQVSGPLDNEYGVLVRVGDDQHFYAFSISGDGYVRAALYDGTSWNVLGPDWQPSDAVHQGEATNLLEVEAQGSTFVFLVNGEQVLQVEDTTYAKGDVGLYAGAFSEGDVVISFDQLEVGP